MTSWHVIGIKLLSNKAQNIVRISQVFSSWLAASFESRMEL